MCVALIAAGVGAASSAYGAYKAGTANDGKTTGDNGGGTNTGTQTGSSNPDWVNNAGQDIYNQAQNVAAKPYTPYTGQMVAGLTESQKQANQLAKAQPGRFQSQFGNVSDIFNKSTNPYGQTFNPNSVTAGVNPQSISTQGFNQADLSGYMNPYIKSVLDPQLADIREQGSIDQNTLNGQAAGSGNFGGSRQALLNDLLQRRTDKNVANATNTAYSQAFNNAGNLFETDQGRNLSGQQAQANINANDISNKLTADQYNQNQALNSFKTNYDVYNTDRTASQNAGNDLLNVINSKANIANNDISNLEKTGGVNQANSQSVLDNQYNQFLQQQNYPRSMTEYLSSILHGTPSIGNVTNQAAPTNSLASNIGNGLQLAGTLNNAYQSYTNGNNNGSTQTTNPFANGSSGWVNPDTQQSSYMPSDSSSFTI